MMSKYTYIFLFIALLMGCTSEPKSDEAVVSEAREVDDRSDEAQKHFLSAGNVINWVGTKPTGRHTGTIRISKGYISEEEGKLNGGSIFMDIKDLKIIDLLSEPSKHKKLYDHLMSADFFDAENYSTAKFVITGIDDYQSDSIEVSKDVEYSIQDPNFMTTGNLTLRDTTLSISFPTRINLNDSLVNISAAFNIDRTRWGISYQDETKVEGRIKDRFIHNKVNIAFDLKVVK